MTYSMLTLLGGKANTQKTGPEPEQPSVPSQTSGLRKYLAVGLVLTVLIGGVYAGFVATHTFTYPSTSAPIVNRSYNVAFLANELTPALTSCSVNPCFTVTGTTPVTVSAWSSLTGGSGVTLTMIQVIPLSTTCSPSQPTNTSGLILVPLPGQPAATITLNGGTDYDYCIYYTSGATIVTGTFAVNYQAV